MNGITWRDLADVPADAFVLEPWRGGMLLDAGPVLETAGPLVAAITDRIAGLQEAMAVAKATRERLLWVDDPARSETADRLVMECALADLHHELKAIEQLASVAAGELERLEGGRQQ